MKYAIGRLQVLVGAYWVLALHAPTLGAAPQAIPEVSEPVVYTNAAAPFSVRVNDLVRRMSLAEKVAQMGTGAPALPRLGIPAYNYWNECLHGVARAGFATVFPQAIGMAASWDDALLRQVSDVISTEARAKYNDTVSPQGESKQNYGLTFWTPNINIFRDPRWGRGQETYGEDPFLTARLAVAFIQGLQGNDPHYVKAAACAKHFAVHSGPEQTRHQFNATPPERDLYETYLPQFEAAVREGHVWGVMGAYNRVNGEPACSSSFLLTDLLRNKWGFKGYVTSDCGAIDDIFAHHKVADTPELAAARAVVAGCDITCGTEFGALIEARKQGLITEAQIDTAVKHLFDLRFRLGMFDSPALVPFSRIPISDNDSPAHHELALKMARESLVLLKNDGLLPLDRSKMKRIAVIGANADSTLMLLGNYNGRPSSLISVFQGIKGSADPGAEIVFEHGCPLALAPGENVGVGNPSFDRAIAVATNADVVIYVGGLSPQLEGEEMRVNAVGFFGGDRTTIELPEVQTAMLKALKATGRPLVLVNCSGSAVALPWEAENVPAILQIWYPGANGGQAVGEALFGETNPGGKLPVTFYRSTADLPAFDDYGMSNRTYRYFSGRPLFAFGHGLSYTQFKFGGLTLESKEIDSAGTVRVRLTVTNTGKRDGEEVVQVYVHHVKSLQPQPGQALCAFRRTAIAAGQTVKVSIDIPVKQFRYWDTAKHDYVVEPGEYELQVGAASDDIRERSILRVTAPKG